MAAAAMACGGSVEGQASGTGGVSPTGGAPLPLDTGTGGLTGGPDLPFQGTGGQELPELQGVAPPPYGTGGTETVASSGGSAGETSLPPLGGVDVPPFEEGGAGGVANVVPHDPPLGGIAPEPYAGGAGGEANEPPVAGGEPLPFEAGGTGS